MGKIKSFYYKNFAKSKIVKYIMIREDGRIETDRIGVIKKGSKGRYFEDGGYFYAIVNKNIFPNTKSRIPVLVYTEGDPNPVPPGLILGDEDQKKIGHMMSIKTIDMLSENKLLQTLVNMSQKDGKQDKLIMVFGVLSLIGIAAVYFMLSQELSAILEILQPERSLPNPNATGSVWGWF